MRATFLLIGLLIAALPAWAADEPGHRPVSVVADGRLAVGRASVFPLYVSRDWTVPQPDIVRAVLVLHGVLRNADVYFRTALKAQAAAGDVGRTSLMIAPQFLAGIDIAPNHLPPEILRWGTTGWEAGDAALGPEHISSFVALDAILAKLADRHLFPHLAQVVVAGHSGGGQVVQRYAIAAEGEAALTSAGIAVRFVVANPSSYAYFSAERPEPVAGCAHFNDWKYGMNGRATYLSRPTPATLEQRYVSRRVIYLLGTEDTNPNHPALDKSCMAETQGPYRYARGKSYVATMRARDGGTPNHDQWDVPGVGHDGDRMFTSACGLAALFDLPGCDKGGR